MKENIAQLKRDMCDIGHRIWQKGFCAGNEGNHSVRVGQDRVLCTPTRLSKGFLTPAMITTVDLAGRQLDTANPHKRTSEILLHLQIYKKRPDIRAIIHCHPPHATAFACSGVSIPEGIHPEAEVFLGKVPLVPYTTPGYEGLGESCCAVITPETNTVLLGNHGTVNFDVTLTEAFYKLEIVDAYCRLLMNIKQLGHVNILSRQQMIDLLKLKEKWGIPDSRLARPETIGADNAAYLALFPKPAFTSPVAPRKHSGKK